MTFSDTRNIAVCTNTNCRSRLSAVFCDADAIYFAIYLLKYSGNTLRIILRSSTNNLSRRGPVRLFTLVHGEARALGDHVHVFKTLFFVRTDRRRLWVRTSREGRSAFLRWLHGRYFTLEHRCPLQVSLFTVSLSVGGRDLSCFLSGPLIGPTAWCYLGREQE